MPTESAVIAPGDTEGLTRLQTARGDTLRQNTDPLGNIRPKTQTRDHGGGPHPETAHNTMGNILSKIVTRLSLNQVSNDGNTTAIIIPPESRTSPMEPETDEMLSPIGSITSISSGTGEHPLRSSLLWPYATDRTKGGIYPGDDDAPLRLRRPALYEEYWADDEEETYVPRASLQTQPRVTAKGDTVGDGERKRAE